MFEKEAEDYALGNIGRNDLLTKAFQDGAKFGYNKTMNEIGNRMESAYREGVAFGKDKANEWHYVKDGDLPKEQQLVMLYRENPNGANVALAYWYKSYVNDKVIAWKEIVLPELKESE